MILYDNEIDILNDIIRRAKAAGVDEIRFSTISSGGRVTVQFSDEEKTETLECPFAYLQEALELVKRGRASAA